MNLQELYLDLIEYEAYRALQVPSGGGSEDAYYEMEIQSIEDAIIAELYYTNPQLKKKRRNRNRYDLNKKAKQKHYNYVNREFGGWDKKPWYNPHKRRCGAAIYKEKKFKRKLRRIPVGEEYFSLKGCGYQHVYEWTWDID